MYHALRGEDHAPGRNPNVTKDSSFLLSADALAESLHSLLGAGTQVTLFTDLARDSIPSHLIGAKVFLLSQGVTRRVVKLGSLEDLLREREHITSARNALLRSRPVSGTVEVRIPEPHGIMPLPAHDMATLELEFCGLHTLERYRSVGQPQDIAAGLAVVLERLKGAGLVWPAAMPRNIAETISLQTGPCLAVLDWERPALDVTNASSDVEFYSRCMELREESAPCVPNLLPYWSRRWPRPEDLDAAPDELRCQVDLTKKPDPRFAQLGESLQLGAIVSDAQYWRLIRVLCGACEPPLSMHSTLYALDHLSEWLGVEWRVDCSLLLWHLSGHPDQRLALCRLVAAQAERTYLQWRTASGTGDAQRIASVALETADIVDGLAEAVLARREWRPYVRDAAARFVVRGSSHTQEIYTVLCMLD
jgi:hypothetical protein